MEIVYRASQVEDFLPEGYFLNEEDCLQYEQEKDTQRFKKEIIGIGCGDEIITIENGLSSFFEKAIVVVIRTQAAADFIAEQGNGFLNEYVDEVGTWYWDSNNGYFVLLEDKKREAINDLARLSSYSEMLENV